MKTNPAIPLFIAATAVLACPAIAFSQAASPAQQSSTSEKQQPSPDPKKPRKVWTNDDFSSAGAPSSAAADQPQHASANASPKQDSHDAKPDAQSPPPGGPPALSDPKTIDEADKMIAWEDRDIAAQQETVAGLQKELEDAPPERKAAIQQTLQQHQRVLNETRQEKQALIEKKEKLLENRPDGYPSSQ